jgi:hypothetical protein
MGDQPFALGSGTAQGTTLRFGTLTVRDWTAQLPDSGWFLPVRVRVAWFHSPLTVPAPQLEGGKATVQPTFDTVPLPIPVLALKLVAVSTHPGAGTFFSFGKLHRPPPVSVAEVMVATPAETLPPKVMPQVMGTPAEDGDVTTMVPASVVNGPSGVIDTALAMEAAPNNRANELTQTRAFKLFIIFPHMYGELFRQGNGLQQKLTTKLRHLPLKPNINSINRINPPIYPIDLLNLQKSEQTNLRQ